MATKQPNIIINVQAIKAPTKPQNKMVISLIFVTIARLVRDPKK
jgi:hypothetical protein